MNTRGLSELIAAGSRPGELVPGIINTVLDRVARPTVALRRRAVPAFQVCGYSGLAVAVALALALVVRRGLSLWPMIGVVASACVTFLALALVAKAILGHEQLVYYHHEIAVVVVAVVVLALLGQPVLAYLDATLLGVGAFLAFGRIGCLMAGCCHGRPSAWGVCYQHEHAAIGLPPYLVGVRLFPIQLIESLWVAAVVIAGAIQVWQGAPPGAALAWYVILYDLGRFVFECRRGDPGRPYYGWFSQAQWLSLVLAVLVSLAELAGWVPLQAWHLGVTVGLGLAMLVISLVNKVARGDAHLIVAPAHVHEIGTAMLDNRLYGDEADNTVLMGSVVTTSLGYRISAGVSAGPSGRVRHVTLSCTTGPPAPASVVAFVRVLDWLEPAAGGFDVVPGGRGTVHLVARGSGL